MDKREKRKQSEYQNHHQNCKTTPKKPRDGLTLVDLQLNQQKKKKRRQSAQHTLYRGKKKEEKDMNGIRKQG